MAQERKAPVGEARRIAALASGVRQEIVDTLSMLGGEASVATLAEQLGRPADGLYYHLRLLQKHAWVAEAEAGDNGERRYRLAGSTRPALEYRPRNRRNADAVQRVARNLMQIAARDFAAALARASVPAEHGPTRQLWAARNKGWVSARDLAEINRMLERLCLLLGRPRSAKRDMLMSLAFVLAPLEPRPGRRGTPKPVARE